ncbi:DUF4190 domain-containing protein [Xylanimonas protaetiae]|uniref:DUF4190 domain-containing protein n=1 Tax=Xylanimonas protaetiae TaxID=2509457 RepID=A0A4P6F5V2_9MICO|nr:DUF4190 domain-containing protein [Xylanimonas protaetiae]QAY69649.1 DUF4190 domain-containing protein [Xylanimonas protaetiae]
MTDPFAPPPPAGSTPPGPTPPGSTTPGPTPPGATPPGTPYVSGAGYPPPTDPSAGYPGSPPAAHDPYGQSPYGQSPYAQDPALSPQEPSAQAPYAPGPHAQPPYEQAPYPQSPYAQSPYATYGARPVPPGTDGISIAALVTGLVGLGVVPLVLGIVGVRRTSRSGQAGKGLAIAGIVLGALQVLFSIAVVLVLVVAGSRGVFNDGATEPGTYYGDNATLDRLWDACEAGDMASCDDLYDLSEEDSDYEYFGWTCGERTDTGDYCTKLDATN